MLAEVLLFALVSLQHTCDAARILAIQSIPTRSHKLVVAPLFEELVARGHQLTVVSSFPRKRPLANMRVIDVSQKLPVTFSNFDFSEITQKMANPFITTLYMADIDLYFCEKILSDKSVQDLYNSEEKFDLVMVETFASDCMVPFAVKFQAPLVAFTTSTVLPWATDRVGLPDNPSYIPNYLMGCSSPMNLFNRVYNTAVLVWAKAVYYYSVVPKTNALVHSILGSDVPPVENIVRNTSLLLVNSHVTLSTVRPFPSNVVEVGGIHIQESLKPLPQEWKNILDRSSDGVILFSLGSMVNVTSIPHSTIEMFLKAFARLPQTIIFKYEEELPDASQNVIVRKWLPQRQIVEHPNVKLVLAHGGLASTIEVAHFGKPFIGVPLYADQFYNVMSVVDKGAGHMLELNGLTEQIIYNTITEVLNNQKYTDNARRLSQQFRDRPMTALQTAVYWTEYVIRHQGAPHLRPASVDLPLYQYLLIDVVVVLSLPLLPIFYLVYFLFFRAVEVSPNDYRNYIKNKKED